MSTSWLSVREVGSRWGMRLLLLLATLFGRRIPRGLLYPITLYYFARTARARRASRQYLQRLGVPTGAVAVYRHLLRFAQCTLDRLFFLRGQLHHFELRYSGREHLAALRESRTGAILLGAHLGAFDALRAAAIGERLTVNVVGYFGNAAVINDLLSAAGDNTGTRFIDLGKSPVEAALAIRKRVEAGELVAILGDRAGYGRSALVPFLGQLAALPTGAFALAAVLGCPVYLTFALHHAPDRYDVYCEPFVQKVDAPRRERERVLTGLAERYAQRLEHYCRLAPDNWFNFYDFWAQSEGG